MLKLKSLFGRTRWLVALDCLLIVLVTMAAFGLTTKLFWWQDDFALLFKLQHIGEPAGYFSPGIWGNGPYRGLVAWIYPFFHWFGLHPSGYFAVAIGIRALAAIATYVFSRFLFSSRFLGLAAALVVATTLTSTDTMLRVQNSFQSFLGLAAVMLTLGTVVASLRTKGWPRIVWYLISFVLLRLMIEGFFVRSHGVALGMVAITLVLGTRRTFASWLEAVIRSLPFLILFRDSYLGESETGHRLSGFAQFITQNRPDAVLNPLSTFGNVFLPQNLTEGVVRLFGGGPAAPLWGAAALGVIPLLFTWLSTLGHAKKILTSVIVGLGVAALPLLARASGHPNDFNMSLPAAAFGLSLGINGLVLAAHWWRQPHYFGPILLASMLWIITSFVIYYAQYPADILDNRHRYLVYALPAVGWMIAIGAWQLTQAFRRSKQHMSVIFGVLVGIVALTGIVGNIRYIKTIVATRSVPTAHFYQDLTKLVPMLQKNALLYVITAPDSRSQGEMKNFFSVGSMPNATAIAIWYGVDRYDFKLIENNDEFLSEAAKGTVPLEHMYVLSYSAKTGLRDLSTQTRAILRDGKDIALDSRLQAKTVIEGEVGVNPIFERADLNLAGTLPVFVRAQLAINPISPAELPARYTDASQPTETAPAAEIARRTPQPLVVQDLDKTFAWLQAWRQFHRADSVTTDSQWKFQESRYLNDYDRTTTWLAHRIHWNDARIETVTLNLPERSSVEGLYWVNGHHTRTPTRYTIEVSSDGTNWQKVKAVDDVRRLPTLSSQVDTFPAQEITKIRMVITDTLEHDAPSLGDIAPVPTGLISVNPETAFALADRPFGAVLDHTSQATAFGFVKSQGAEVLALYNVDKLGWRLDNLVRTTVRVGGTQSLEVLLPGGFGLLEGVRLAGFSVPATVSLNNFSLHYPSLEELKMRGLIKTFSEN